MTHIEIDQDAILAFLAKVKAIGGIHKLTVGDVTVEFSPEARAVRAPQEPKDPNLPPKDDQGGLVNHFLSLVGRGAE